MDGEFEATGQGAAWPSCPRQAVMPGVPQETPTIQTRCVRHGRTPGADATRFRTLADLELRTARRRNRRALGDTEGRRTTQNVNASNSLSFQFFVRPRVFVLRVLSSSGSLRRPFPGRRGPSRKAVARRTRWDWGRRGDGRPWDDPREVRDGGASGGGGGGTVPGSAG